VNDKTETETGKIVARPRVVVRTAVFGVVLELGFEREVLGLLVDGQRQVEEPVGVVGRDANALLLERALVDLKTDQCEDRQDEHRQNADVT